MSISSATVGAKNVTIFSQASAPKTDAFNALFSQASTSKTDAFNALFREDKIRNRDIAIKLLNNYLPNSEQYGGYESLSTVHLFKLFEQELSPDNVRKLLVNLTVEVDILVMSEWSLQQNETFKSRLLSGENPETLETVEDILLRMCQPVAVEQEPRNFFYVPFMMQQVQEFITDIDEAAGKLFEANLRCLELAFMVDLFTIQPEDDISFQAWDKKLEPYWELSRILKNYHGKLN